MSVLSVPKSELTAEISSGLVSPPLLPVVLALITSTIDLLQKYRFIDLR